MTFEISNFEGPLFVLVYVTYVLQIVKSYRILSLNDKLVDTIDFILDPYDLCYLYTNFDELIMFRENFKFYQNKNHKSNAAQCKAAR